MATKIILSSNVADFIWECVDRCEGEVGGVGYAKVDANDNIYVDHTFLIPQEVSPGGVDFGDDAVAIAIERAVEDGRLDDLRFSWHSHGNLGVFWSNTDEKGIEDYMASGMPWLASIVFNRQGETRGRVDIQGVPLVGAVKLDKVPVSQIKRAPNEHQQRAIAEIETYVKEDPMIGKAPGNNWRTQGSYTKPSQPQNSPIKGPNNNTSRTAGNAGNPRKSGGASGKEGAADAASPNKDHTPRVTEIVRSSSEIAELEEAANGFNSTDPDEIDTAFDLTDNEIRELIAFGIPAHQLAKMSHDELLDALIECQLDGVVV